MYGGSLPSVAALLICMTACPEGEHADFFFCASTIRICRSGGRGMVFSSDLYNRWCCFWHACQRVGRASALNLLFFALPPFEFYGAGGGR